MSRTVARAGVLTAGTAIILLSGAGIAAARPTVTPEPGGVLTIGAPPGEWWKCVAYSNTAPYRIGTPPIVNYPVPSASWGRTDETGVPQPFSTGPATLRFHPGQQVLVDCVSEYLPLIWVQTAQAGQ
ncbi:hypothetical protein ACFVUS_06085 [Nocardia sp. NPDC058058]|uniref:hypothetical protein n=1 Tax=Nocardia sp. NPDC058058 TaxID=3346317 RepID=UPI0036DB6AD7